MIMTFNNCRVCYRGCYTSWHGYEERTTNHIKSQKGKCLEDSTNVFKYTNPKLIFNKYGVRYHKRYCEVFEGSEVLCE